MHRGHDELHIHQPVQPAAQTLWSSFFRSLQIADNNPMNLMERQLSVTRGASGINFFPNDL
jgi:hypothetical protein